VKITEFDLFERFVEGFRAGHSCSCADEKLFPEFAEFQGIGLLILMPEAGVFPGFWTFTYN